MYDQLIIIVDIKKKQLTNMYNVHSTWMNFNQAFKSFYKNEIK